MERSRELMDNVELKKEQYRKLNVELAKMEQNLQRLNTNVKETLEQAPVFREMGTYHASLFMAMQQATKPKDTPR